MELRDPDLKKWCDFRERHKPLLKVCPISGRKTGLLVQLEGERIQSWIIHFEISMIGLDTLLVCVCLKFIQKVDIYLNVSLSILRIHFNGCIGKITTSFRRNTARKSLSNPVISLKVCNLSLYIFAWLAGLGPFWMVVSFHVSTELYNSGSGIKAVLKQFHLDF